MSLQVLQTYTAVTNSQGLSVPFGATGGSSPYLFSVLPGGAGGSIGSLTGIYTAPATIGIDVIQVTDSASTPAIANASLAVLSAIQLVADIIRSEMGLSQDQVYLYNQKYDIPLDSRLYVAVGMNSLKSFGNRPRYVGGSSALTAIQTTNVVASLSIHVFSRSVLALLQKEQVLLALSSPYAESQMELNSFFVAPVTTSISDISVVDGAAIPYHYFFSVNLQYFSQKTTSPAYFSTFPMTSVITDDVQVVPIIPNPGPFSILLVEE